MTPFDYFFQLGAGMTMGLAMIILPSIWIYNRWIKERGNQFATQKTTGSLANRGARRDS